jgi:hypothetical protein
VKLKNFATFSPGADNRSLIMQQRTLTFEAILEGLVLNFAFDPEVMTRKYIENCIPQLTRFATDLSS